jgi:hypothetical protein
MRAIVLQAGDEDAINTALGYPTPCYRASDGRVVPGVYSLRHRDPETDTLARQVLVVDDVETALPAPLRARVVNVTIQAVAVEEPVVG